MIVKKLYQKRNIQLNYYEIKNNLQPLILIHAQGVDAVSFESVWGQLSKSYHIYSVDCYGHGESLHNAKEYNVEDISKAIICFIEDVVREKVFLLGHSSGGLIAAYGYQSVLENARKSSKMVTEQKYQSHSNGK